jgi:acetyl esterase/lipase
LLKSSSAGVVDGRQAVRFVRENAARWGIKKDRIGLLGFSAGAIITRSVATDYDAHSRPDFAVHIYGPLLEPIKVPSDAPPLFILTTADDTLSEASSVRLYDAWRSAGRQAELHIFEKGGHGFGMAHKGLPVDRWTQRLGDWLAQRRFISAQPQ